MRGARGAERLNDLRVDRLDPVQRLDEVGQQDDRIVVAVVDGDPADAARLRAAHCASRVVLP